MAFVPQLTRWLHVTDDDGSERHAVEFEGTVAVAKGDNKSGHIEIGGRPFTVANERNVAVGGRVHRCVDFEGRFLTVTDESEVAEVEGAGTEAAAVHALGSESYIDKRTGTLEHFVDVQDDQEAIVLLVSVREEERRIVKIHRFS